MRPGPPAPDLPDLFLFQDGARVHTAQDWPLRRREIQSTLLTLQYGPLPAVPDALQQIAQVDCARIAVVKALVAPRALLTTEALGDLWANPAGTWHTHVAARAAYQLLGAEDACRVAYREGGHDHSPADWDVLLDHCDVALRGAALKPALHHVYALAP